MSRAKRTGWNGDSLLISSTERDDRSPAVSAGSSGTVMGSATGSGGAGGRVAFGSVVAVRFDKLDGTAFAVLKATVRELQLENLSSRLFVSYQDVPEVCLYQGIVYRQVRSSRKPKDYVYALFLKGLNQRFCACHLNQFYLSPN